jgi:HK97 family phage portal protein
VKIGPLNINIRWERRSTLANPQQWLIEALGGGKAASGVAVNETTAMKSTVVFACVRILAETIASLPLPVYRRLQGGGKERANNHYLYPLLHDQPNPEMTSFEFRETLMGHLALWGNAYAEIERDGAGRVRALWPLRPDRMQVKRDDQGLRYEYLLPDGTMAALRQTNVMHIRGLSGDGIVGYSPIRLAREAIGFSLATEEFGARFFGQGAHPGGIVEYPGKLSDEARKRYKESVQEAYGGLGKAHRLMVLEEGLKYTQVGIPPEDAQFLATREFQAIEIARIFRIPPYLLQDFSRATFSNVEHTAISFVVHTVRPWLIRIEQAFKRDLFPSPERDTYFAEFLVDGLLRGDIKSRYDAYAVGRNWGWLSADDIRELENMNPLPDGQGKIYLIPTNMRPANQAGHSTIEDPPKKNNGGEANET